MHLTKLSVRLIALLAVIAAVLVAFGSVAPGAPDDTAVATGPTLAPNVTCADVYVDLSVVHGQKRRLPDLLEILIQ